MITALISGGHLMVGLQENITYLLRTNHRIFCHILSEQTRERTGQILEISQSISLMDTLDIVNPGNMADLTFSIGMNSRKKINNTQDISKPKEILTYRYG